jgi:cytochrome c biogenesis protein
VDSNFSSKVEHEEQLGARPTQLAFWPRWFWRQLTSMRVALLLLLLLAIAAVPGSIYPQRTANPNGVRLFFSENPELAPVLDSLQLFDVYESVWFSAIYILLFVSLIGCVLPRTLVHWKAVRARPVATPPNLKRMPAHLELETEKSEAEVLATTAALLTKRGFRVATDTNSVSAEKGYSRETGNLVFHFSLIGVLAAVAIGGGFGYSGQRVLVEGDTFVNNLSNFDSFSPGTFFDPERLKPFTLTLEKFEVDFDLLNPGSLGTPVDFRAFVSVFDGQREERSVVRVNHPAAVPDAHVYLTGNGYAPVVTVRDGDGNIAFSGPVIFLPQDGNYTSLGVIKAPDASPEQLGIIAFFYPTAATLPSGAYTSIFPSPFEPLLTMNVYAGDLGLDDGVPRNVYALDTTDLELIAGRDAEFEAIELTVGERAELPNGRGSISFDGLLRFASLDIAFDPAQVWVLVFSLIALFSVTASLTIPRRRIWLRVGGLETGAAGAKIEVAALARNDDPRLAEWLSEQVAAIETELASKLVPATTREKA